MPTPESLSAELLGFLASRNPAEWVLGCALVLIFLEVPRYHLPGLLVALLRLRSRPAARAHSARLPTVSVVVACRNEEQGITRCLTSLLEQDVPLLEILVIDDASDDRTGELARRFDGRRGLRVIRNDSVRGRGGKPAALNLGLALARGEILVSVDADSSFDPGAVRGLLRGFSDARVGCVAGNVAVDNPGASVVAALQALEYAVSIDLRKSWTDLFGCTLQASGAFAGFRRSALAGIGGWDQEVAEDTDVSLRLRTAGWMLVFAPDAICRTDVPHRLRDLRRQRFRWDRSGLVVFFRKHRRLMFGRPAGWALALELWNEWLYAVLATLVFPVYLAYLALQGPFVFAAILGLSGLAYLVLSLIDWAVVCAVSRSVRHPASLWRAALLMPLYKEGLRWFRLHAILALLCERPYHDRFLPHNAWVHSPPK